MALPRLRVRASRAARHSSPVTPLRADCERLGLDRETPALDEPRSSGPTPDRRSLARAERKRSMTLPLPWFGQGRAAVPTKQSGRYDRERRRADLFALKEPENIRRSVNDIHAPAAMTVSTIRGSVT